VPNDNNASTNAPSSTVSVPTGTPTAIPSLSISDLDADSSSTAYTVALSVTHGALVLGVTQGLSISNGILGTGTLGGTPTLEFGSDDGSILLTGSYNDVNAALASVTYIPDSGYTGNDTFTISVIDGGAFTDSDGFTLSIGAVNAAPVISDLAGDTASYVESSPPVLLDIDSNAVVTDDNANFDGGLFTVAIVTNKNSAQDIIAFAEDPDFGLNENDDGTAFQVILDGVIIGEMPFEYGATGDNISIALNENATAAAITRLIGLLTYSNTDNLHPTTDTRGVEISLTDGGGPDAETTTVQTFVEVTDAPEVNHAPVLDLSGPSVAGNDVIRPYSENAAAVRLAPSATSTDEDTFTTRYNGGSITVAVTGATAADQLTMVSQGHVVIENGNAVNHDGSIVATFSGGTNGAPLVISFLPAAASADTPPYVASDIVKSIAYASSSDAPPAQRTITITLNDGGGTDFGGTDTVVATATVNITSANDVPVVDLDTAAIGVNDSGTYTEGGSAGLGANIAVRDADGDMIHGAVVTITDGVPGDLLAAATALPAGITIDPSSTATMLVLTGTASAADYTTALGQLTYTNGGDDPAAGGSDPTRTITVTVNDGTVNSAPATLTLTLSGVDDASVAQPDAFTTDEVTVKTGSVFADNGSGADSDPDNALVVTAVNGSAGNVGAPFALPSGALLTLNADGTFSYDPNHAFDATPVSDDALDSFSYTLTDGATATVSVTISGVDNNDVLVGTSGTDTMAGGAGDDRYYVNQPGDLALENAGEGYDRVLAGVSYVLPTGSEIEKLTTDDNFSTAPIDLTGNEFAQYLFGNAGANRLDGAGGADVMVGLGGDDRFYVDTAGDRVIEAAGEGYDRVFSAVSWTLQAGSQVDKITTSDNLATTAINLTGNNLSQYLFGNAGANILDGGGGGDVLVGLGGDDRYIIRNSADRVIEEAAGGNDRVLAGASFVLQPGSEVETLSTIDNLGTTVIDLTGNELGQYLFGNAGANVLDGKLGNDVLYGLDGSDTFQFTTVPGANNVDRIADFVTGVDRIALDDFIFTGLQAGTLNANAFHVGSAAHDADDRIIYNQSTGALYFDYDGNGHGAAVQFATLNGAPILAASDFQVI